MRCARSQGHSAPNQTKEFPPLHFRSMPKNWHHMAQADLLEEVKLASHRCAVNVSVGSKGGIPALLDLGRLQT
jgi:hypothetical protein